MSGKNKYLKKYFYVNQIKYFHKSVRYLYDLKTIFFVIGEIIDK